MRKQLWITCAFTSSFLNISDRTSSGSTLKIAFSKAGCKRKREKKIVRNQLKFKVSQHAIQSYLFYFLLRYDTVWQHWKDRQNTTIGKVKHNLWVLENLRPSWNFRIVFVKDHNAHLTHLIILQSSLRCLKCLNTFLFTSFYMQQKLKEKGRMCLWIHIWAWWK